ncbi:hypothetical protein [Marmoricola sp. RAF53]|uniref:hypothetical protein n=1 Tax=Marmoricola sp. RAF53 TaxID=3233059 RepID=UPI003F9D4DA1
MNDPVAVAATADGWECEFPYHDQRAILAVVDRLGVLTVIGLRWESDGAGGLTPSVLSRAPYARWIRAAKDSIAARRTASTRLVQPTDLLLRPFLEDRRGTTARTETDYAQLADVYVSAGGAARSLAQDLASRYGGSVQTWRNRLTVAKRYTEAIHRFDEDDLDAAPLTVLTDEAMRLLYGDDYRAAFDIDAAIERQFAGATAFIRRHESPESSGDVLAAKLEARRLGEARLKRKLAAAHRVLRDLG